MYLRSLRGSLSHPIDGEDCLPVRSIQNHSVDCSDEELSDGEAFPESRDAHFAINGEEVGRGKRD